MSKKKVERRFTDTGVRISKDGQTVEYPMPNTNTVLIKKDGHLSQRFNNPGNLTDTFESKINSPIGRKNGFAIFPNMETGIKAQEELLKRPKYQKGNIADAMYQYAPPKENNTEAYIKFIYDKTGMDRNTSVKGMDSAKFAAYVGSIRQYEGSKDSTEYIVPKAMSGFAVLSPKEISQLKVSRSPIKPVNPVKHHSHASALSGRTLRRVGDTVYRIENGKIAGSFSCNGKKK